MFFKKKFSVQQKIDSVKRYEEFQFTNNPAAGMLHMYPRCIDPANDKWEIAFIVHLTGKQFEHFKNSSQNSTVNVRSAYHSFLYENFIIPVVFIRLNNQEELSFAGIIDVAAFKDKNHPMFEANLVQIFNEQQKIHLTLVAEGQKLPGIYVTNNMRGSLAKDVGIVQGTKFTASTAAQSTMAVDNLVFRTHMDNHDNPDYSFGVFLWKKFLPNV